MIELMNVVQALDPKKLRDEMRAQGVPLVNVKPLLQFIADKTNGDRILEGSWYSVATMCDILGVSRTNLYKMRDAAEKLGLILVIEDPSDPDERGKTSVLVLTDTITLYVNQKLYERIAGIGKACSYSEWYGRLPVWFLGTIWDEYFEALFPDVWHPVRETGGTVPSADREGTLRVRIPYPLWTEWVRSADGYRTLSEAEPEVVTQKESQGNTKKGRKAGYSDSTPTDNQGHGIEICSLQGCGRELVDGRCPKHPKRFQMEVETCDEPECVLELGHEGECLNKNGFPVAAIEEV